MINIYIEAEKMQSSIYLLTSNYEGLPMVMLETMACGVASVAFACKCGPWDVIQDKINGCLIPEGNIQEFAEAVSTLIQDESLRKTMGIAAKKTIKNKFTEDVIMQQWTNMFYS